jgi:hypothetical protein
MNTTGGFRMSEKFKRSGSMLCGSLVLLSFFACGNDDGGSHRLAVAAVQNEQGKSDAGERDLLQHPLFGEWRCGSSTITIKQDNAYSVDLDQDDRPEAWGTVRISGNLILFSDSGGSNACIDRATEDSISGSYTYMLRGTELTFSSFHDPCNRREAFLRHAYHRGSSPSTVE